MSVETLFSEADLARIREQTRLSEQLHGGEIVPYIIGRTDDFAVSRWRAATLGAILASFFAISLGGVTGTSVLDLLLGMLLLVPGGAGIGYGLSSLPKVERALLFDREIEKRVHERAEIAFLEQGVFNTRDRTGILIFLAIYERRAVILADEGIDKRVPEGAWQTMLDALLAGIRQGEATDALCETIRQCATLLQSYQLERRDDDHNELHDDVRLKER